MTAYYFKLIVTEVQVHIHSNYSACVKKTLILHFQNKVSKNDITIEVENNKCFRQFLILLSKKSHLVLEFAILMLRFKNLL